MTSLLLLASLAYAVGGLFMKQSAGATRGLPTLAFVLLFVAGSVLQAVAMRKSDMGVSYVFVLGVEAVAAVALSAVVLREPWTASRVAAVIVVLAGIAWLRRA